MKRAFQTLLTYIANVAKNPENEKFRKIRLSNPAFMVPKKIKSSALIFYVSEC